MRYTPFRRTPVCWSKCRIQSIAVSLSVQPFGEVLITQEGGEVGVSVPGGKVVNALYNQERRQEVYSKYPTSDR